MAIPLRSPSGFDTFDAVDERQADALRSFGWQDADAPAPEAPDEAPADPADVPSVEED